MIFIIFLPDVAIQGVLQGFGEIYPPLIISVLRLLFPVLPLAWLFTRGENAAELLWRAFPVSEMIAAAVAGLFLFLRLRRARKQAPRPETNANEQSAAAPEL